MSGRGNKTMISQDYVNGFLCQLARSLSLKRTNRALAQTPPTSAVGYDRSGLDDDITARRVLGSIWAQHAVPNALHHVKKIIYIPTVLVPFSRARATSEP